MHLAFDIDSRVTTTVEQAIIKYTWDLVSSKRFFCPHCRKRVIPVRPDWKQMHWRHIQSSEGCPEYYPGQNVNGFPDDLTIRQFLSRFGYSINNDSDPFQPDLSSWKRSIWIKSFTTISSWQEEDIQELGKCLSLNNDSILLITKPKLTTINFFNGKHFNSIDSIFCKDCRRILIRQNKKLYCYFCSSEKNVKEPEILWNFIDAPSKLETTIAQTLDRDLCVFHVGGESTYLGPVAVPWLISVNKKQLVKLFLPQPLGSLARGNFKQSKWSAEIEDEITEKLAYQLGQVIRALGDNRLQQEWPQKRFGGQVVQEYLDMIDIILKNQRN